MSQENLQIVEGQPDTDMENKSRQVVADIILINRTLEMTKYCFSQIYGEDPDEGSDLWKWYLTEVFDKNLRLAVTQSKNQR